MMDNFRAIAMGIEDYLHWKPLKGAETNAQTVYRYFFNEAKFSSHQLLLLTDTSPSPGKRSTYPNRDNILQWINDRPLNIQHFWFFFQGYGVNYQGEDYLLPIDSNPQTIPQTGIKLRSLFEKLQTGTQQLLVILDLQNPYKDGKLGQTTLELARKKEIPLIFSCRSHVYQTISAEKGILTTALIEALRYYGQQLTLAKLDAYLQERLTASHQSNFPAIALPIIVSPSSAISRQPLLPKRITETQTSPQPSSNPLQQRIGQTTVNQPITRLTLPKLPQSPPLTKSNLTQPSQSPQQILTTTPDTVSAKEESKEAHLSHKPWIASPYQKWLWWGGGIMLLLGLLWIIPGKIWQSFQVSQPEKRADDQLILDSAKVPLSRQQASRFNEAIQLARQIQPRHPLYQAAQSNINRWSRAILDIAQGRATQEDFSGAIAAAQLVPQDNHTLYNRAQQLIQRWQEHSQQQADNKVLIETALALVEPNQASSYHRAIITLSYLTPEEPGYQTAQRLIEQLSQQIYQLAQIRAEQEQLTLAIKTAQLVPKNSPIYEQSQQRIAQWQRQLHHR